MPPPGRAPSTGNGACNKHAHGCKTDGETMKAAPVAVNRKLLIREGIYDDGD